jgi:hypothetical protein
VADDKEPEKPFVPKFGPNGAVMNAPGMTEKMRHDIAQAERHPRGYWQREFYRSIAPLMVIGIVSYLVMAFGGDFADSMMAQENFFGAMTVPVFGIPAGVFFAVLVSIGFGLALKRWEVMGVAPADRKLAAPFSMRLALAAVEFGFQLVIFGGLFVALSSEALYLSGIVTTLAGWIGVYGLFRLIRARGWRDEFIKE